MIPNSASVIMVNRIDVARHKLANGVDDDVPKFRDLNNEFKIFHFNHSSSYLVPPPPPKKKSG